MSLAEGITALHQMITDLEAQNKTLREENDLLKPYAEWVRMQGRHSFFCQARMRFKDGVCKPAGECTCGLSRLLNAIGEKK